MPPRRAPSLAFSSHVGDGAAVVGLGAGVVGLGAGVVGVGDGVVGVGAGVVRAGEGRDERELETSGLGTGWLEPGDGPAGDHADGETVLTGRVAGGLRDAERWR